MISCTTHIFNATAASFMRHTKLGVETETLVTHSWSDVSRWNLTKIHIHHPSHEQEKVGKIQPGVSKPTFKVPCWVGTWNEPPVQSKVQVLLNTLFAFAVLLDQHSSQLAWLDLPFTFTVHTDIFNHCKHGHQLDEVFINSTWMIHEVNKVLKNQQYP